MPLTDTAVPTQKVSGKIVRTGELRLAVPEPARATVESSLAAENILG